MPYTSALIRRGRRKRDNELTLYPRKNPDFTGFFRKFIIQEKRKSQVLTQLCVMDAGGGLRKVYR